MSSSATKTRSAPRSRSAPCSLRVVGVLEPLGTDVHGMDRDDEIVVPISTAMRRLMNVDTIRGAKLLVRNPSEVEATAREVERILRERHALAAGQPSDFELMTAVQVQQMVARVQRILFLFLPLVAGVSLVACGCRERQPDAGVRERAGVGDRPAACRRRAAEGHPHAVPPREHGHRRSRAESSASPSVACVAVIVAGRLHLGSVLSWQAIALGVALSAVTGVAGGVLPARRAALLRPVEALR